MSGQTPRTRSQVTLLFRNPTTHQDSDYPTPSAWASAVRDGVECILSDRSWCLGIEPVSAGSPLSVEPEAPEDLCLIFDIEHQPRRSAPELERAIRASLRRELDAELHDETVTESAT